MIKKKIIFDFDSVLCNFVEPWLEWLKEQRHTNYQFKPEDVLSYDWIEKNFGHASKQFFLEDPFEAYSRIKPYKGAKELLNWCFDVFEEVEILTHASQYTTKQAKTWFIDKYFDTHKVKYFDKIEDKYRYTAGSILIDDYPFHVIKHISTHNDPGIVFNHEGRNGWGHLDGYIDLLKNEKPDLKLYHEAHSFDEVKKSLLQLF